MVTRRAQWGGSLFLVGTVQFVMCMILVQWKYPGYSDSANFISDLGSATSPWAWLFNDSIRILGLLSVGGAAMIYAAFAPRTSSKLGVGALIVGSLGAIGVGTFPEMSPQLGGNIHSLLALIAFLGSGLGLVLLSLAMLRDTRWDGYRLFTILSGIVTLLALGLFIPGIYLGLGPGGMERVIVAPILLWGVVIGLHLIRMELYDPSTLGSSNSWSPG